jgi:hypothetical protein
MKIIHVKEALDLGEKSDQKLPAVMRIELALDSLAIGQG